jgi:hypothetical protein
MNNVQKWKIFENDMYAKQGKHILFYIIATFFK